MNMSCSSWGRARPLIEWDADIPALSVLMGEAAKAQQRMSVHHG
jgi:uncharacterized protein (UPF0276 family)